MVSTLSVTTPRTMSLSSSLTMLVLVSTCLFYETTKLVDAFAPSFISQHRYQKTVLNRFGSSSSSSSAEHGLHHHHHHHHNNDHNDNERRRVEFINLEPLVLTDTRKQRIEFEQQKRAKFVSFGNDLWDLRSTMDTLASELVNAIRHGQETYEDTTREQLRDFEQRDPELVYMLELADFEQAMREGRTSDAENHREKAMAARSCLPYFNLDGLWVGKYGINGYQLINITYVGDTLIATKLTGDKNVPRGEITFQVDLHPLRQKHDLIPKASASLFNKGPQQRKEKASNGHGLQPIPLTEKAARKWGTKKLARYAGLGQVAEEGFQNHQWMEGQLIIIGEEYFSFAWIPIEHQIFFGRPSPELALKLLREQGVDPLRREYLSSLFESFDKPPSVDDDIRTQTRFAMRCLEVTNEIEDELHLQLGGTQTINSILESCIWHPADEGEDERFFTSYFE